MSEQDQDLKAALAREPVPQPRAGAKADAVRLAMAAFDEKKSGARQGSGFAVRLKGIWSAVADTLFGRRNMKMNPALAGGVSLSVLVVAGLAAISVQQQSGRISSFDMPSAKIETPPDPREESDLQVVGPPIPSLPSAETAAEIARVMRRDVAREALEDQALTRQALNQAAPGAPIGAVPPALAPQRQFASESAPGSAMQRRSLRKVETLTATADQSSGATIAAMPQQEVPAPGYRVQGRDRFPDADANPVKLTAEEPVSTFSIDVDTASYALVRASLNSGVLPPPDAVRIEEMVNYFPYDYPRPTDASAPFRASVSVVPSPFAEERKLIHIGIAGYELPQAEAPAANLVFLVDVSGSMNAPDKLPLLVNSLKMLLDRLKPDDTVAIVTYAGNAGTVLAPTKVSEKAKIVAALSGLHSGGSTAGAEGIRQAYELARSSFKQGGVNRVLLATDGDFNVGITDSDELEGYISRQRDSGIHLSVLGFGRGNYNDALMQTLAQNGNGNAAYIDTLNEARKVLVEEAGSTLFTIAGDVKLQIEFNPAVVAEYRLIGYETRLLDRADFNNDRVDAGDIGAGHTVTAIYEITPAASDARLVDDLRYGAARPATDSAGRAGSGGATDSEYGFLKIRYKLPNESESRLITTAIGPGDEIDDLAAASAETRFATAVAGFGQLLRGGRYTGPYSYDDVIAAGLAARGDDPFGYRAEFVNLVRLAKAAAAMEPLQRR